MIQRTLVLVFGAMWLLLSACGGAAPRLDIPSPNNPSPEPPVQNAPIFPTEAPDSSSPIRASTLSNLSTLTDPVQETVRYAVLPGGAAPRHFIPVSPCPNHYLNNTTTFLAGQDSGLDTVGGVDPVGRVTINTNVAFCMNFPNVLDENDLVTVQINDSEGLVAIQSAFYDDIAGIESIIRQIEVRMLAERLDPQQLQYNQGYNSAIAAMFVPVDSRIFMPGEYRATLYVNGQVIDQTSFIIVDEMIQRVPRLRISYWSGRLGVRIADEQVRVGDIIRFEYSDFPPNATIPMALALLRPDTNWQEGQATKILSWNVQVNDRGYLREEYRIDKALPAGRYVPWSEYVDPQERGINEVARIGAVQGTGDLEIESAIVYDMDLEQLNDQTVHDGMRVLSVAPDSPASAAYIKTGDIILTANGRSINRIEDWLEVVRQSTNTEPIDINMSVNVPSFSDSERRLGFISSSVTPQNNAIGVELCEVRRCLFDHGVKIQSVDAGSPAAAAGLQRDQIILEMNGLRLTSASDLEVVSRAFSDTPILTKIWNRGEEQIIPLTPNNGTVGVAACALPECP